MIIDFHTHHFPDRIAENAMKVLTESAKCENIQPHTKATLADNLSYMDRVGVDKMVTLNIAVVKKQERSINDYVIANTNNRIIPFGSVHPDSDNWQNELKRLVDAKIVGVKFHPEYQQIDADDKRWYPIYEYCAAHGLIMSLHCGFDVAFPKTRRATPKIMAKLSKEFKGAKFVCAHFGGMYMWEDVLSYLAGQSVYLDTSMCAGYMDREIAVRIVNKHGADNILYGSDLPWGGAKENIDFVQQFRLSTSDTEKILGQNALRLFKESGYAIQE